ncbi:rotatin [Venturia canescens]|uniref:rotatin n=1 Tax=Venturia canescens TaxID=32260 RepID=UPI001C9C62A9|nr:rotatin-like [Venturia canescens]
MDNMNVDESGVKWLFMPWQPLVTSDIAVLTAVEESLVNSLDTTLIVHTCQFVTNVMLQDFPAEVFIQRPAIVTILQALLDQNTNQESKVSLAVMKTLYKLTRSLRYRIHYYCDPALANKRPNVIFGQSEVSWTYESSLDDRETPEGGLQEGNYQGHRQQFTASQESPEIIETNLDDSLLRQQQMSVPFYCTETLKNVLSLFSQLPIDSSPLKIVKNILELSSELVNLVIISLKPSIWLSNDTISLNVNENLKSLLRLLAELMEYFGPSSIDLHRIIYLQIVCLVEKILSNLVPLEIADIVLPKNLKVSIAQCLLDAPIFLISDGLNLNLEQYARQFTDSEATDILELFDDTKSVTTSLEAAINLMSENMNTGRSNYETLKLMWTAKSSFSCHKRLFLVKKYITFLQEVSVLLEKEEKDLANKLILDLLSNEDEDLRKTTYEECHRLVSLALGVEARQIGKFTWIKVAFLLNTSVMTEIICHGVAGDDNAIKNLAEDILVYILKGKIHIGEEGWNKFLEEALIPTLGLLQCIAATDSQLGQCVAKMLDPDVYESLNLPYIEVIKGNSRLLYSADSKLREEALCRLIFLLGCEKDSSKKLPRLSSLHGLPLSSLCIIERSHSRFKRSEGNYLTSSLLAVLELIKTPDVEPKVRKSALVQLSVMLTDTCLHKLFIREHGLPLVLDIMNKSLIEREFGNYPDSVIPLLAILKALAMTQSSVRHDLSTRPEVYSNILRSLFLFPNNESIKIDASQLLCLLLYSEYIKIPTTIGDGESNVVSLPHVIATKMRIPLNCKSYWKENERREKNIFHSNKPEALTFLRQFWFWQTNGGTEELLQNFQNSSSKESLPDMLQITDLELLKLSHSSVYYCVRLQLLNIQNSTMHVQVIEALDYLTMYLNLWKILCADSNVVKLKKLPWEQSFVRFLLSQPTNKEDCDLFVDVINFLYVFINTGINAKSDDWLGRIIRKNLTRSLTDLIGTINTDNQEIHEAVLKLVRAASALHDVSSIDQSSHDNSWIGFVQLVVSNLCFGDQQQNSHHEKQQHFYNLAYLDWLLRCLMYLTSKCHWPEHKDLLSSLGNALIELIVSFYGAGTVSFMGLSITRNSIICLNHLIHEMQNIFRKNEWIDFWYDDDRNLSWMPMLWRNRDPLVRASAFQLLSALTRSEHNAHQLLKAITLAPSDLCHTLLRHFTNREECCIVREQACIALANLVKNSNKTSCQYVDTLKSGALIIYIEQSNIYYEISVLCSNIYLGTSVYFEQRETHGTKSEHSGTLEEEEDGCRRFVATPSLISATCTLLNNLILLGGEDVAKHIYEQSLDKYFLGCFGVIPSLDELDKRSLTQYCDILEMYISLCTLLTNCISHCQEFAIAANFSSETLYILLTYLEKENYHEDDRVTYLRKNLIMEVYNFLSILSLTENGGQHLEAIMSSAELETGAERVLISICRSMKDSHHELRMASIGCLAFLLAIEIRRRCEVDENTRGQRSEDFVEITISDYLDNCLVKPSDFISDENYELQKVLSSLNKLTVAQHSENPTKITKNQMHNEKIHMGSEMSKILIHLFIAHNYAKSMKEASSITRDKDTIVGALSNLLCLSKEAKKTALLENLGETCLLSLKELHTEFTLQPYQVYKTRSNREKKVYPVLNETKRVLDLLMNFMYNSDEIKERLAKAGLADCLHKLWAWISLDNRTVTSALELVATFTTNCSEGTLSLTMTNAVHGTGLRRSPNATSLLHTIINLICREIDKAGRKFDNQKIHFAFHILRNAIHVHECRVAITKSNLLQVFEKIHPASTRRTKPWSLLEVYFLEFFNDFTFYEEGQVSVAKATDGLDVLIELARSSTPATRLLAISTLRNLVFNPANRARLLASAAFMNLLHSTFEGGTFNEIGITGSILWSLVANNQKGKLTIRSAGFSQSIQEVLGRLSLLDMADERQRQDLAKILHYVVKMLSSSEGQISTEVG